MTELETGRGGAARCTGALLTGGASRRLGDDKAKVAVGGVRLADRAARVLGAVCDPVVEVGPGVTGWATIREQPVGSGPLGALVAVATSGVDAPVLLLACDLPFVEVPLLDLLTHWPGETTVVPVADGGLQPVCARYGPDSLRVAVDAFAEGERSLRGLLARSDHEALPESAWRRVAPAHAFVDVDTAADLEHARRLVATGGGHTGSLDPA